MIPLFLHFSICNHSILEFLQLHWTCHIFRLVLVTSSPLQHPHQVQSLFLLPLSSTTAFSVSSPPREPPDPLWISLPFEDRWCAVVGGWSFTVAPPYWGHLCENVMVVEPSRTTPLLLNLWDHPLMVMLPLRNQDLVFWSTTPSPCKHVTLTRDATDGAHYSYRSVSPKVSFSTRKSMM